MDDEELTHVVCRILGAIDGWAYHEDDTPYPADLVGVRYGKVLDNPDESVGVRVYGGEDPADLKTRSVQLLVRGKRRDVAGADRLADKARRRLHKVSRQFGISSIQRTSFGPLGADTNLREERSENYQIILDNTELSA